MRERGYVKTAVVQKLLDTLWLRTLARTKKLEAVESVNFIIIIMQLLENNILSSDRCVRRHHDKENYLAFLLKQFTSDSDELPQRFAVILQFHL